MAVLSIASLMMCLRLRRVKSFEDPSSDPTVDILRPYHQSSRHHWSVSSALPKPR